MGTNLATDPSPFLIVKDIDNALGLGDEADILINLPKKA